MTHGCQLESVPRRPIERADLVAIGQRIRELRGDVSQDDFGPWLGISQSQLSKIELGKLPPSIEVLLQLRKRFNRPIDWILTGEG